MFHSWTVCSPGRSSATTWGATAPISRPAAGLAKSWPMTPGATLWGGEDGSQNRTTYRLDAWGRITGIVKADGSTEYYAYDYVGNMTMLHQMAEDYEVDPVYVLDMYRHGRLGVFAVLAAAKMGI